MPQQWTKKATTCNQFILIATLSATGHMLQRMPFSIHLRNNKSKTYFPLFGHNAENPYSHQAQYSHKIFKMQQELIYQNNIRAKKSIQHYVSIIFYSRIGLNEGKIRYILEMPTNEDISDFFSIYVQVKLHIKPDDFSSPRMHTSQPHYSRILLRTNESTFHLSFLSFDRQENAVVNVSRPIQTCDQKSIQIHTTMIWCFTVSFSLNWRVP